MRNKDVLQQALDKQVMKVKPIKKEFVFIILPFVIYMNNNGNREIHIGWLFKTYTIKL